MKPILKNIAVTALISLGICACGSGGGSSGSSTSSTTDTSGTTSSTTNTSESSTSSTGSTSSTDMTTVQTGEIAEVINESDADKYEWRQFRLSDGKYLDVRQMSKGNQQGIFTGEIASGGLYTIVNQPYSAYGFINDSGWFYNTPPTSYKSHPAFHEDYVVTTADGNKEIKESLRGDATYVGPVISGQSHDGTVTLNAHFAKTDQESYVSGTVDSKTVGIIDLQKTELGWGKQGPLGVAIKQADGSYYGEDSLRFSGQASGNGTTGVYQGTFGGPDLNDVAGALKVGSYTAVYGGTKQ